MGYYNPYRYSGTSGSGNYGQGAGSSYSYGQQSSNPWRMGQNSSYGQPYNVQPYQQSQPQSQGWGDQWSQSGYGGYPGQSQRPPAGKGPGMGGIGMGPRGGGMGQYQRQRAGDMYRGNDPFQIYGDLLRQRGMEQQLGLSPGSPWRGPQNVPGHELHHAPWWQGLYPGSGGF